MTQMITPNILCMKKAQGFIASEDPKLWALQEKNLLLRKQMDDLTTDVLTIRPS